MILISIINRYYVDCDGLQICANNVIYNIYDYFRIIFDNEGADWTFVCPPNYKNITNKEKRITEFFNDGVDAITEFLKQIGYDVPINVPRRYRRHMDYLKNSEY